MQMNNTQDLLVDIQDQMLTPLGLINGSTVDTGTVKCYTCKKCKISKPVTQYYSDTSTKSGIRIVME